MLLKLLHDSQEESLVINSSQTLVIVRQRQLHGTQAIGALVMLLKLLHDTQEESLVINSSQTLVIVRQRRLHGTQAIRALVIAWNFLHDRPGATTLNPNQIPQRMNLEVNYCGKNVPIGGQDLVLGLGWWLQLALFAALCFSSFQHCMTEPALLVRTLHCFDYLHPNLWTSCLGICCLPKTSRVLFHLTVCVSA